jgi:hypothetical protein
VQLFDNWFDPIESGLRDRAREFLQQTICEATRCSTARAMPPGQAVERLETLLRKGKSSAQRLLKARILLKADVSEAGEGWSDSRIIKALGTSVSMIYRVRKQLVEEGFEAVLSRKQRATPAVARIFDGEKEAKLITLACCKPPKGRARWTLRLLENKVVELGIVDRASDSTIGRTLKKHSPAPSPTAVGYPAEGQQRVRSGDGKTCWPSTPVHMRRTLKARGSAAFRRCGLVSHDHKGRV